MESLLRIKEVDPGLLSCIDYLMAAADYESFISLMLDFREGFEWEGVDPEIMDLLGDVIEEDE